jgi:membrane-associated protease RseP (regulator of RpoE activity)
MFGASETPYDLRFQLLGIPVRVHPFFWLVMAMLGWHPENMPVVLIFVGCAFLSILVHEYGHGLTARAFGSPASIVLWGMGGLCYNNADRQTPGQRLAVLLCGPGAGFALCLVTMMFFSAGFGLTADEHAAFVKYLLWMDPDRGAMEDGLRKLGYAQDHHALNAPFYIYFFLIEINIIWGLLNLLPVWPLDGGQATLVVLSQVSPHHGRRWTHTISLVVAGLFAVMIYALSQSLLNTILFAYFAVINYQMLDSIHRAQTLGVYEDDWWRR